MTRGPGCWACGYDSVYFGHAPDCYDGMIPDYDDWEGFERAIEYEYGFQSLAITIVWENLGIPEPIVLL